MTTPIDLLRREHDLILRAVDALEAGTDRLEQGASLSAAWWADLVDWLGAFADRSHHAREERALFPAMAAAGLPADGGPLEVMVAEHVEGRGLLQGMRAADAAGRARCARRYGELLRAHIDKENSVLFPLAEALLDGDALRAVGREFEALAGAAGVEGALAYAAAVLEGLVGAAGSPPAATGAGRLR
jgi:hemerythrin-like domain-containing protein